MKVFYFLVLIFVLSSIQAYKHKAFHEVIQEKPSDPENVFWFDQELDHFDFLSKETFRQRYYVNDTNYVAGGPVFLFLGGEGELTDKWIQEGLTVELSVMYNALVVALEHRYYGESMPFDELKTENMKYLSSQQALADILKFRDLIMKKYSLPENTKWISFGCSYSGALSLWLRIKYPHLIAGAYSGSSPVEAKMDYVEYDETCEAALSATDSSCLNSVQTAFSSIKDLLETENGRVQLQQMFNTCQPIDTDDRIKLFKYNVIGAIQGSVQYNNAPSFPRLALCQAMNSATDKISAYAQLNNEMNGNLCLDLTYDFITNRTAAPENNGRPWYWQKASEFAYYKNSPDGSQIFFRDIDAEFHNKIVEIGFGEYLTPRVGFTNEFYGSKSPVVNDAIFTNGLYDPWSKLSVLKDIGDVSSIIYTSSGHCAPVYPFDPKMPSDVQKARNDVGVFVRNIILQD
eukprot:Anaeramoba_ignava/a349176_555.p1 GENE.a349176_555~~a349176_555.p1  ORF type:complete len:459 (-),score=88.92 a349176_555:119-1495(-)